MYNEKVIDYIMHPRNAGSIENPSAVGEVGNPTCGDVMKIYLKINDETRVIEDIKFETFGCAAAIATSSMVTELAKGKTLEDALKITNRDVAEALGGLPAIKLHCSLLAQEGLQAAAGDYYMKRDGKLPEGFTIPTNAKACNACGCGVDIEEEEEYVSEDNRQAD